MARKKKEIRDLLQRIQSNPNDQEAKDLLETFLAENPNKVKKVIAQMDFDTASYRSIAVDLQGRERRTWVNAIGNQIVEPLELFEPESMEDLQKIIRDAEEKGFRVKAVGAGHSYSDITNTTDYLINMICLDKVLPLDKNVLKSDVNADRLFHFEGGDNSGGAQ